MSENVEVAETNDLFTVMGSCRAMRRLRPDPVPDELLFRLIESAGCAPSGRNLQRARWIVVRDEDQRKAIAALHRRFSEPHARRQLLRAGGVAHHDPDRRRRMWEAVLWLAEHLHEVPVLVVACCILDDPDQDPDRYAGSIWPGVQNLLLAARALGLGAVPTTYVLRDRAGLARILELPARVTPVSLIPVGYPMRQFGPVRRLPVEEIMMVDRWAGPVPETA
jgi:nitroreductase